MSFGMIAFYHLFPQQALAETRSITLRGDPALPDDDYALFESYCDDPSCDCRRVMLNVISRKQNKVVATINYGFDRGEPMAGPFLDPLNPQSKLSDALLALVTRVVLSDSAYLARLEAHYYQVKGLAAHPRKSASATARPPGKAPVLKPSPRGAKRRPR